MRPLGRSVPALVVALLIGATGCGSSGDADEPGSARSGDVGRDAPRPLTQEESQRLSVMRFTNLNAGVRSVRFELNHSGRRYTVDGWVDFEAGLGYVGLREDADEPPALIAWTAQGITSHDPVGAGRTPPVPPPDTARGAPAWTSSALTPTASRLHAALAVLLEAGSDRPDNPVLLQQTDARWLRSDELDSVPVDVVAGPTSDHVYDADISTSAGDGSDATIRYWIDQSSVLLRMEMRLGGGPDWTVVDFGDASGVEFADAFQTVGG